MHAMRSLLAATVLGAVAFVPSVASAGITTPLSSIATLPVATPLKIPETPATVPGLALSSKDGPRATRWHELTAATGRGYCIQSTDGGLSWASSRSTSSNGSAEDFGLVRLVDKDDTVTLEQTRVHFDPPSGSVTAMSRSSVALKEIARTPTGVVVWAYREGKNVVVVARNVERGIESRRSSSNETASPFASVDGCAFAGARLDGRRPEAGSVVQLTGNLPARGKGKDKVVPKFIVDASVSHVTRDPEPMLAVRVRVQD